MIAPIQETAGVPPAQTNLGNYKIQKITVYDLMHILFELYSGTKEGSEKCWIYFVFEQSGIDIRISRAKPADIPNKQDIQKSATTLALLKREFLGAKVSLGSFTTTNPTLWHLQASRADGAMASLWVECGQDSRIVLTQDTDAQHNILHVVGSTKNTQNRDLRRGAVYLPPTFHPKAQPKTPPKIATVSPANSPIPNTVLPPIVAVVTASLKKERKRLQKLLIALDEDRQKHGDPEKLRMCGELVKSHLHVIARGWTVFSVEDHTGHILQIDLDPALSPIDNLQNYFKRSKRAQAAIDHIEPRRQQVLSGITLCDEKLAQLQNIQKQVSASIDTLHDESLEKLCAQIQSDLANLPSSIKRAKRREIALENAAITKKNDAVRLPYRTFLCAGDISVRVGRSARDNESLCFQYARGNDLWLHARDTAGAHVVISHSVKPYQAAVADDALFTDAAHLAAWFSPQRNEAVAVVQYTQIKYLRRPAKGSAAGTVVVSQEQVKHIKIDSARMQKLLDAEITQNKS